MASVEASGFELSPRLSRGGISLESLKFKITNLVMPRVVAMEDPHCREELTFRERQHLPITDPQVVEMVNEVAIRLGAEPEDNPDHAAIVQASVEHRLQELEDLRAQNMVVRQVPLNFRVGIGATVEEIAPQLGIELAEATSLQE